MSPTISPLPNHPQMFSSTLVQLMQRVMLKISHRLKKGSNYII